MYSMGRAKDSVEKSVGHQAAFPLASWTTGKSSKADPIQKEELK